MAGKCCALLLNTSHVLLDLEESKIGSGRDICIFNRGARMDTTTKHLNTPRGSYVPNDTH